MTGQLIFSLTLLMVYLLAVSLQPRTLESLTSPYAKRLPFMRKAMGTLWFPSNTKLTPLKRQPFS